MKRHQYAPGWRSSGEDTCPLCAHRGAGRIARETYREIQVERRTYPRRYKIDRRNVCKVVNRANFQRNKT